jgi:glycine cleavage system H protein
MSYPKEYKYTKDHEWIHPQGNTALVGITNYAQESLGDIVFVELPKPGAQFERGKSFGTVESVKAVSELYAPASGKVAAINESLNQAPEIINKDANEAWMIKLELSNPKELDSLLSAEEYEAYIAEEKAS